MAEKTIRKPVHPVARIGRRYLVIGSLFILAALGGGRGSPLPA